MFKVIIIVILEADLRLLCRRRRERDDAGEVIPATEEVELYPCEEGEEGECV